MFPPVALRRAAGAAALLLALLWAPPSPAAVLYRQDGARFEDARVARALGDAMVLGRRDDRWSYAERNLPVERRDVYLTGASGELSLEFGGGVIVDLDHATRLEVTDPRRGPRLRLERGAVYLVLLEHRTAQDQVRVSWDGGGLYMGDRGSYRLDRFADGTVRAMVLRGRARVKAGGGGRHLDPGEAILIGRTGFASRETSYRPGDYDAFDRAVIDRYTGLFGYRPPRHFPHVLVGFWELDTHGTWLYVPAWRAYCWKPRHPGRDWRPFRAGKWRRTPRGAWTWIPQESWGHTTSHYGAWSYLAGQGWVWKPGRTYSPGRVRWVRSGDYLGWAPVGPGGKPVGPAGAKSPFLFTRGDRLGTGQPAGPVSGLPVPPDAPTAEDPASLMPSLAGGYGAPSGGAMDESAEQAAGEAEAEGWEVARERGERVLEEAGAEAALPPEPLAEAGPAPAPPAEENGDPLLPAGFAPPVQPADSPEAPGVTAAVPPGPEIAVPAPLAQPAPAEGAPQEGPAAESLPPGEADAVLEKVSKKALQEAERARRRAANDAKKAQASAAREAERERKALERAARRAGGEQADAPAREVPSAD